MEPPETALVGNASDPLDLRVERVAGRRDRWTAVHLEVLGHRVHVVAQRLEKAGIPDRGRGDDAREEDHRDACRARTCHDRHPILSRRSRAWRWPWGSK